MEEISAQNCAELEKRYRSAAFIVSAQIVLTIVLTLAAFFIAPQSQISVSQSSLTTLWIAIIFIAIGAFVLRRMFFRWDRLKDIALLKGIRGLISTLQANAIILAAFAGLIAVVGFVIAVLSGDAFEMLRAGLVALIAFVINFPRKSVWEKIVGGMEKVQEVM